MPAGVDLSEVSLPGRRVPEGRQCLGSQHHGACPFLRLVREEISGQAVTFCGTEANGRDPRDQSGSRSAGNGVTTLVLAKKPTGVSGREDMNKIRGSRQTFIPFVQVSFG